MVYYEAIDHNDRNDGQEYRKRWGGVGRMALSVLDVGRDQRRSPVDRSTNNGQHQHTHRREKHTCRMK